jgi:succinoglycan biosynthesis protein ExoM
MPRKHHICVCICTFKRPELLNKLLSKLDEQETEGLFDYSIVVVDNDRSESAREIVECYARQSKTSIRYYMEPEQNIALARNKTVDNAEGDFVAFIDDDEYPMEKWLLNLYKALHYFASDGVLGPVLPCFEKEPPRWILKGCFFDRPTHPTGHVLVWKNTRTGNALLKKDLFTEDHGGFNPAFGSGGEDRDFFRRKIEEGHVFVWCNEGQVFEIVPPERWKRKVFLKRALVRGKMAINSTMSRPVNVFISLFAITLYTCCLPLFLVLDHHIFMKYLIKDFDHIGKVLAFLGIEVVRDKYITH